MFSVRIDNRVYGRFDTFKKAYRLAVSLRGNSSTIGIWHKKVIVALVY